MKTYNKKEPLIFIHIPKTGGTSAKGVFQQWFEKNLYFHYFNEIKGVMPQKIEINKPFESPLCIYGHFNKNRAFGIQDYYPKVNQFITILRDPFELVVSEYFYLQKIGHNWQDQSRIPEKNLTDYLDIVVPNMLNHFPFELTIHNYEKLLEKYFIHIGIIEEIMESLQCIAKKLNFKAPVTIEKLNTTDRKQKVNYELKQKFIEKYPVEFAVYNFAKKNYNT